ncbi:hypothetical protein BX666DRAFT_1926209 [Dichotomocladium elegans]|nr:hypothetical protein BX666DRAFT_1926209 [Dichotomocladium elegans]
MSTSTNDSNQNQPSHLETMGTTSIQTRTADSSVPEPKRESLPPPDHSHFQQTQPQQPLQRQQNQQLQPQTHEYTRRYIQWKEEDIALLLDDLEKPGHYESWKTNKSGYGKRVAEEVFRDILYQDGIKFKVRWLENRIRKYDQILTIEENQGGEPARLKLLEKIHKEFPFYHRVKRIVESARSSSSSSSSPPAEQQQQNDTSTSTATAHPQLSHSASSSSSSTQSHDFSQTATSSCVHAADKETAETPSPQRAEYNAGPLQVIQSNGTTQPATAGPSASSPIATLNQTNAPHNSYILSGGISKRRKIAHRVSDDLTRDRQIRMMELELESKKMDHDERMQQMKLEQLRLEIELEKIRSGRHNS